MKNWNPRLIIIFLSTVLTPLTVRAQANQATTSQTDDVVLRYAITTLLGNLAGQLHEARKTNIESAREIARQHYSVLFVVWMSTQEIDGKQLSRIDLKPYFGGTKSMWKRESAAELIDMNDPVRWKTIDPSIAREHVIAATGGPELVRRVLQQTAKDEDYARYVRKFRQELERERGRGE